MTELGENLGFGIYGVTYFTMVCYKFLGFLAGLSLILRHFLDHVACVRPEFTVSSLGKETPTAPIKGFGLVLRALGPLYGG